MIEEWKKLKIQTSVHSIVNIEFQFNQIYLLLTNSPLYLIAKQKKNIIKVYQCLLLNDPSLTPVIYPYNTVNVVSNLCYSNN